MRLGIGHTLAARIAMAALNGPLMLLLAGGPLLVYRTARTRAKQREAQLHARFDAALEERTRVARELHDTLLQGFTGVTLQLQAVQHSVAEEPQHVTGRLTSILSLADETLTMSSKSSV